MDSDLQKQKDEQQQQDQQLQKEKVKYTPDNKAIINVRFKGSNSYELQLTQMSGFIQLILSCKQNMFFRWVTNINLDEELSKQPDLQELCEGVTIEEFQQGMIDYIENNQYSIEPDNQNAVIYFNDEVTVKKMNKQVSIPKQFKFVLHQEDLMEAGKDKGEDQPGYQKIATSLQDRIIVLENENKELADQLELILDYIGTSAQEVKDFQQNPFTFSGISNIIKNNKQVKNLQKWIPEKFRQKKARLIFRASLNEYSAKKFHQNCDGLGPLLIVLKSEAGDIYGGFVPDSKNWDINKNIKQRPTEQKDPQNQPFIFVLGENANVKCSLNDGQVRQQAYQTIRDFGPVMGGNPDFSISDGEQKTFSFYAGYTFNDVGLDHNNNIHEETYDDYEVFQL